MVEGIAGVTNRLSRLVPEAVEQRVREAMETAATQVVSDIRTLAPVDTGRLKGTIGWTWGAAPKGAVEIASATAGNAADDRGLKITIYAGGGAAFYARFVEFGTRKMRPHAFFYPAYRANKRRIKSAITRALSKAIKDNLK
jgi:HK97 gp10 family phage protein